MSNSLDPDHDRLFSVLSGVHAILNETENATPEFLVIYIQNDASK